MPSHRKKSEGPGLVPAPRDDEEHCITSGSKKPSHVAPSEAAYTHVSYTSSNTDRERLKFSLSLTPRITFHLVILVCAVNMVSLGVLSEAHEWSVWWARDASGSEASHQKTPAADWLRPPDSEAAAQLTRRESEGPTNACLPVRAAAAAAAAAAVDAAAAAVDAAAVDAAADDITVADVAVLLMLLSIIITLYSSMIFKARSHPLLCITRHSIAFPRRHRIT